MTEPTTLTPAARRVLDAASRLFYARGLHAVGVDTIAAEAGVTKKTLYDRFGSKEALEVAYLRARDARWEERLRDALAACPGAGTDRVLVLFDAVEGWMATEGGRGCAAINARAEVDDPAHPVAVEVSRQKTWVRELLRTECHAAGLARPDALADALVLLYDGALAGSGTGVPGDPFAVARRAARTLCEAHGA
ncbi:TetR/AcrR family transcriptional regulator [Krasilnikoviella flava]|uniref:Transcriptional regulator, TetR family n=1 Tax=Krasilnikoviella flava TaxID=526729 RepID=A0A1T5LRP1_9MICO|nr:TetR/AcrR family transcriptional regulator [Krasilnikoviella flava]SKC78208.1 transcriptional regulator, TetR family [Krasilnikoviella flava]